MLKKYDTGAASKHVYNIVTDDKSLSPKVNRSRLYEENVFNLYKRQPLVHEIFITTS